MRPRDVSRGLSKVVGAMHFASPVDRVYDPLSYAQEPHEDYLDRYGSTNREILLLGMNPGPFGMAQTGVPFGEVSLVRDWLGVKGKVTKPPREHPKRPVDGFDCTRSEVSGRRLWGWAKDRYKTPEKFFERFFVLNYCPLVFMSESGKNLTPDKLPAKERDPLLAACDEALRALAGFYSPKLVIGVGAFAMKRAQTALEGMDLEVATILHPSPASPAANKGWAQAAEKQLSALGAL